MRGIASGLALLAGALLAGCGRPAAPPAEPHAALESLPRRMAGLEITSLSDPGDSSLSPASPPIQQHAQYRITRGRAAASPAGAAPASGGGSDLRVSISTYSNPELLGLALRIRLRKAVDCVGLETPHGVVYETSRESFFCFNSHFVVVESMTDAARDAGLPATAARVVQTALAGDPGTGGPAFFGRPLW